MTATEASVSIIICAYTLDRWQDICEAIESARQQEPPPLEVILVCDHNPELEALAKAEFPGITVTANREAQGLSGARNSGIAVARGRFVAFLDDDAVADKLWSARLLAECSEEDIAGATGKIEPLWVGKRPAWFPSEFLWTVGCSYRGLPAQRQEVRNLFGGASAWRRDLALHAGGFNQSLGRTKSALPISCEETEFCIRLRRSIGRARFVYQPAAFIRHKVTAQRLTWAYFTLRCYAEGISKARMAALVGTDLGLSTERSYVLNTLTSGFAAGIGAAALRLDLGGLARAGAIVWGLGCTIAGFSVGRIQTFSWGRRARASLVGAPHLEANSAE